MSFQDIIWIIICGLVGGAIAEYVVKKIYKKRKT